jgi:hypothetical protein
VAFTPIIVTGPVINPDGTPANGTIVFTPTAEMVNGSTLAPVIDQEVSVVNGVFSQTLMANDDGGTLPLNQGYWVREKLGSKPGIPYTVIIPHAASGGTVALAALPHASVTPAFFTIAFDVAFEAMVRANSLDQFTPPQGLLGINGQRLTNVGPPLALTDGARALGSLLAATYYEPAGGAAYTINSTTGAAMDATNLTVTFTAISSAVLVELSAAAALFSGAGAYLWGLFLHGTTTQQGYWVAAAASNTASFITAKIRVSGLAPGTSYQFDWAHCVGGGTPPTGITNIKTLTGAGAVADVGPGIIKVLAA